MAFFEVKDTSWTTRYTFTACQAALIRNRDSFVYVVSDVNADRAIEAANPALDAAIVVSGQPSVHEGFRTLALKRE